MKTAAFGKVRADDFLVPADKKNQKFFHKRNSLKKTPHQKLGVAKRLCERGDLNPHREWLPHYHLKVARLPVPPLPQKRTEETN